MTDPREQSETATQQLDLDPTEYASFIGQIEFGGIWLQSAEVSNQFGPDTPDNAVLNIDDETSWEQLPEGFRAFHKYTIRFESTSDQLAEVTVKFAVDFYSELEMTNQIFEVFSRVNLPVNTWPYLREFVSSTMTRMNWSPFVLPALKRGTN